MTCPRWAIAGIAVMLGAPDPAAGHVPLERQIAGVSRRIAEHPGDAALYLERGDLYRRQRDWARAIADLDRAAELDPSDPEVERLRGETYLESGRARDAEAALTRYLASLEAGDDDRDRRASAMVLLGKAARRLGRPADAAARFRQAVELAARPDPQIFLDCARAFADAGRQTAPDCLGHGLDRLEGAEPNAPAASAGGGAASVTRGPYLQRATPTGLVVRWRTDVATDSRVSWGDAPGNLTDFADDPARVTEHEVVVEGLLPATTYFYAVGTTGEILAGADASTFFVTSPPAGTQQPTRVWVIGDSGTANADARAVRDAYLAFTGSRYTDLWLMLGDNAYPSGTDAEYQAAVFATYPSLLRQTVLWPALGNHDGISADSSTQTGPYYDIFTLPAAGEAGGFPSGTEAYYSFDHANIHFICLDSEGSDRSVGGAMYNWLESDLAATTQEWIIAYWHHPPYTKGSHNSDTESKLVDMRTNILPLLEDGGVDLVFNGHSHSYERSFLIDGHYGVSTTFAAEMKIDGGDGRPGGDGAYNKAAGGRQGTVYCVAGSSGKLTSGPLNHPVMFHSVLTLGSVVLDVDGNRLDATFVDSTGAVDDTFTLIQGATQPWDDLGQGLAGTSGEPRLAGYGALIADETVNLILTNALPGGSTNLVIGFTAVNAPFKFGTLVPFPHITAAGLPIDGQGALAVPFPWLSGAPAGFELFYQYWLQDPAGPVGWAASNAVRSTAP